MDIDPRAEEKHALARLRADQEAERVNSDQAFTRGAIVLFDTYLAESLLEDPARPLAEVFRMVGLETTARILEQRRETE
jgi:hypothetical protein